MKKKSILKISIDSTLFDESNNLLWKNRYWIKKENNYACYICKKFKSVSIPTITYNQKGLFFNRENKHVEECHYYFKKIKKIIKFYETFKSDLEDFREIISLFKEKINSGIIGNDKLTIVDKTEEIIKLCLDCILLKNKKKRIKNPYDCIITLMKELEKVK